MFGVKRESRLFMIEPGWLLETHRENDFSQGLQTWSVFKSFGPVNYFKRNRTAGVRRPDDKDFRRKDCSRS